MRDERTWESSCEYGLFRSPAMAVSVDAVPPPATPRGLHPRQRASFLQGWSNTTLRGGTLRSSRGHYLAPPPVGMSRVGSFASRSVLSAGSARTRALARVRSRPPGDRQELSCLTTVSRQSERNFTHVSGVNFLFSSGGIAPGDDAPRRPRRPQSPARHTGRSFTD